MMKKFLYLIGLYLAFLLIIFGLLTKCISNYVKNKDFKNYETESNLLVMDHNEKFDLLFMGMSHARNLSRHKNHLRIENILQKKIINIAQGRGKCGINEQLFYLEYFYHQKNKTSTVVYLISPPMFYAEDLDNASNTFDFEPFELNFLWRYLFFPTTNKWERIRSYLQTKFTKPWYSHHPESSDAKKEILKNINWETVNKYQELIFEGKSEINERFVLSADRVKQSIEMALKNNSKVVLIIPPAAFGKWMVHETVENFARKMQQFDGVEFYDFSEAVMQPEYYYDHHHLNTDGVVFFTEKFLQPILK